MSTAGPSPAELENLGVLYIGFVAATVLYGLTFFQTYIYYSRYPRDRQWIKYFVAVLSLLDLAVSALVSEVLYYHLIILYDVNLDVLYATTTFCVQYTISVLIIFLSQLFFAYRVFQVTGGSRLVTLAVTCLTFVSFVFGLTASGQMFVQRRLSAFGSPPMEITAVMSLVMSVMADVIVFMTMCVSLRRARYPDIAVPQGLWPIIITVLVGRGLAFTIAQISYFLVFIIAPSRPLWIPLQMVASKVYINTLLAHLNLREVKYGQGFNEEDSLTDCKSAPALSRLPARVDVTDAKGTTQTVHFATERTDTESGGTELDTRKTFQDEQGNTFADVSLASMQSQSENDEGKVSLSEQIH